MDADGDDVDGDEMAAVEPLTRERVLDAAEETLRRFGPAKTTVVDAARVLGVSHAAVYRHFASKAELRDAVLERWLERMNPPLAQIAQREGPAGERLRAWVVTLSGLKRARAQDDPDLFAAYALLSDQSRGAVRGHVADLTAQLERIVADGMASGEFAAGDAYAAAVAVFDATSRFHHPAHASDWAGLQTDRRLDAVCGLLLSGLTAR
ncbi:MAG TPA: TetR family transcriptional regulator [Actinocrinis sp.]